MAKVAGLEVIFSVNGKTMAIGAETLARIISDLPDDNNSLNFYAECAKSTSFEIRENVASKDNLDEATVALLAGDSVDEVLFNLLRSDSAKYLTQDAVVNMISKNTKLAAAMADRLSNFENLDIAKLYELLLTSSDPMVRQNIANSYDAPKKILKGLLKDEDAGVIAAAKNTLE